MALDFSAAGLLVLSSSHAIGRRLTYSTGLGDSTSSTPPLLMTIDYNY